MTPTKKITVLAIETSCDETGVALVTKEGDKIVINSQQVASQADIHSLTGGVIPEVAAREHVAVIKPILEKVMAESGIDPSYIDAVAVTVGPGLQPALAVGVTAAQALALAWGKPIVPIHHLEGHIYSALLGETEKLDQSLLPALALIVSGGHTLLVIVKNLLEYEIIGQTLDDAAGEAFDKVARLLGLGYPGGPAISRIAEQGNPKAFILPRPLAGSKDYNFSFSGLKTAVLYAWQDISEEEKPYKQSDMAASFQAAVVDSLTAKTQAAMQVIQPRSLLLTGGVAANTSLQVAVTALAERNKVPLRLAPASLMGDNAGMIGQAGCIAYEQGRQKSWQELDATARINLEEFNLRQSKQLLAADGIED